MRKAALTASTLLLLGVTSAAHAGGYVSLGIGADAEIGGDLAGYFDGEGTSNGRLSVGQRNGPFAIEASLFGTDLNDVSGSESDYSTLSLGVDVKYYVSLTGPIEGYGRGGLNKTWLVSDSAAPGTLDYEGRGYSLGVGLQYSFRWMPLGEAAIWLDYTHQAVTLHDPARESLEGSVQLLMVGATIGL